MRKFYWVVFFATALCSASKAQPFFLVKDINPGINAANPGYFTSVNGSIFFQATDGEHGAELWKTDGTEAGTILIKDINPGPGNSYPIDLININGTVFFYANDGIHGDEVWKTDGTKDGTVMVKDINPGSANGGPSRFLKINNLLFFSANDGTHGVELWKTDGTVAGTAMVKDINPGINNSSPVSFENLNGKLFFSAVNISTGRELWKSDGTETGTMLVKDIIAGPDGSSVASIKNINGMLLFAAGAGQPTTLWRSDGTEAGTIMIKGNGLPEWLTVVNGTLYFTCFGIGFGTELWKSDGTEAGTIMVKDIKTGTSPSNPTTLTEVNGTLFFLANTGNGYKLWKSDGTEIGTTALRDLSAAYLTNINGTLYCAGNDGIHGTEIWRSDGTQDGTVMVQDIANPGNGLPTEFILVGSKLFVSVTDNTHGRELWVAGISTPIGGLPITMVDFKGRLAGNNALLSWNTVAEHNTSHFEIERSIDRGPFTKVGSVNGAGNSATIKQYDYSDRNITLMGASVVYYRLKMVDVDGKFTYSKIITININSNDADVMLYPNPVYENTTLIIAALKKENISYRIIDQNGKIVQQKNISINEGSNVINIETNSLAGGVYTIVLKGTYTNEQVKFIKQ